MDVRPDPSLSGLPVLVCNADSEGLNQIAERLSETQHVETLTKPFSIDGLTDAVDWLLGQAVSG